MKLTMFTQTKSKPRIVAYDPTFRTVPTVLSRRSKSNPVQASGQVNREQRSISTATCSIAKLVKNMVQLSSSDDKQDGPPGFVYHVLDPPKGHSRESMVDMFHALTQWAEENPGPGKRPQLKTPTSKDDLLAENTFRPEGPESYDILCKMTKARIETVPPVHTPASASFPKDFDEEDKRTAKPVISRAAEAKLAYPALNPDVTDGYTECLIDLSDGGLRASDTYTSGEGHEIHPDLLLLKPWYDRSHGEKSQYEFTEQARKDRPSSTLPSQPSAASDQHSNSSKRYRDVDKESPYRVPKRVSSRLVAGAGIGSNHYLGVGLRPVTKSPMSTVLATADSVLPEKLRLARLEASAQVVKRRPVPKTYHAGTEKENSQGTATSSAPRAQTEVFPAGVHLGQQGQVEELVTYKPYRPQHRSEADTQRKPVRDRNDREPPREKIGRLRRHESFLFRAVGHDNTDECSKPKNLQQESHHFTPAPVIGSKSTCPAGPKLNLPYLAATSAFGNDVALRRLQKFDANEMHFQTPATKSQVIQLGTQQSSMRDLRGRGNQKSFDGQHLEMHPQHKESKFASISFPRSPSRETYRRHLRTERSPCDEATHSTMNLPCSNHLLRSGAPNYLQPLRSHPTGHREQSERNPREKGHLNGHTADPVHHEKQTVREKVELFEAKSDPNAAANPITRHKENFEWPRFSDRQYVDPASEYTAKWKEVRKLRRRGMIFDADEIARIL